MKLEVDFNSKTIKVVESSNFKELMEFIQTLPEWEQYSINANVAVNWGTPIVIERDRWPCSPTDWPWTPSYYSGTCVGEWSNQSVIGENNEIINSLSGVIQYEVR